MIVRNTELAGVFLIEPRRHSDARGFFLESWNQRAFQEHGLDLEFVQDNHSLSVDIGTLRGLHFQAPPHAQAKLVRCTQGSALDVVVDIRRGSPTFGRWLGFDISADNDRQVLVPEGFLHGFVTREPGTEVMYKVTDYYSRDCDGAVRWDSCGIDWGIDGMPILSDKDAGAPRFAEFDTPFEWTGA